MRHRVAGGGGRRAVAGGARFAAPAPSRPAWLLVVAGAVAVGIAGLGGLASAAESPAPNLADVFVVGGCIPAIIGILLLAGGGHRGRCTDNALEALLVTGPVAYVAAVVVLDRRPGTIPVTESLLAIGMVAVAVVLVVLSADLVRVQQHRLNASALLVLAGSFALLATQAARAGLLFASSVPSATTARLLSAAPALVAVLWAGARLHPDARREHDPAPMAPTALTRTRVSIVLVSVLVGPLVLAVRLGQARTDDVATLTAGAVVVATVAIAYLLRLVEQRARIEFLALHDDLCGIPNRVLLGDRIASALAQASRHEGRVALLFLDLDRFKTINDSLGHDVGNELLRAAAGRLRDSVRAGDTVARLGGDEFAILLPEVADAGAAAFVAEKVLLAFEPPFEIAGRGLFASPSIGVSLYPDDAGDADQLLRNADAAMYRAKHNGRNTFELYTREMNARAHQRLTLENSLHQAIERDELVMHYQPKIELRTGRIVGMEALMRWRHPMLGLLLPGEFIPLAEETGLIVPLGEWALEQSCRQTQAWAEAGHDGLTVAVNLSARQFQHQQVGDMVARVLRATGLDPSSLELELTESLALQEPDTIIATLRELRDMGVHCSIDDFGTGYSGLAYLTRFPISKLKIDKFFVSEISVGGDNARIVAAVIALAHGLRLEVIAEGVESIEQHEFLLEHGCDVMQGFLFSQALPARVFEQLLLRPGPQLAYDSGGGQAQTRFRSPAAPSMRLTGGQYLPLRSEAIG